MGVLERFRDFLRQSSSHISLYLGSVGLLRNVAQTGTTGAPLSVDTLGECCKACSFKVTTTSDLDFMDQWIKSSIAPVLPLA